jgi:tetratricopeptide (TPR) repeat protein
MAVTTFNTLSLEDALAEAEDRDGRRGVPVRRELDIGAFGISAGRAEREGIDLIREHDELGPGSDEHEELYFISSGHAEFTVDGETIDAPAGTLVFVRDPGAKRSAVAKQDGTTVVSVGGRRGHAYRMTPGEAMRPFFEPYNEKDYEGAAAAAREMLEDYPGNALGFYNLACVQSLSGRTDEAFEHLTTAVETAPRLKQNARDDEDFAAIRDDPRFAKLISD